MATVTDSSTGSYTIKFDSDGSGGSEFFKVRWDTSLLKTVFGFQTGQSVMEFPRVAPTFRADGMVHLESSSSTSNIVDWTLFNIYLKANLSSQGELTLTNASLRIPILSTLPSSPVQGMMLIYADTSGGSARRRLAAYLNGAWRYSSDL